MTTTARILVSQDGRIVPWGDTWMEYGDQLVVVSLIVLRLSRKGDVAYLQKNTKMRKRSAYK